MKEIKIYCDRCGALLSAKKSFNTHGYQIIGFKYEWDKLDLCQNCYDSLYHWMEQEVKKEVENDD